MNKGEGIKKGLKTLGWLVAFPVPVTKALATKKGGKLGRKAATIAATWAMYASLATAGVAAMVPNNKPDDKVVDSVGYVVDGPDVDDQNPDDETGTVQNPKGIIIQDHAEILGVGEEMSVIANAYPYNLPDSYAVLKWRSSDESVATVNQNGKITGMGVGTAQIVITTVNGLRETFDITVEPCRSVPVSVSVTSGKQTFNLDDWDFFLYIEEDMDHDNFRPETSVTEEGYVGEFNLVPGRRIRAYVTFNYRYSRGTDTGWASEWHKVTDEDLGTGFEFVLPVNFSHGEETSDFPDENIVVTVDFGSVYTEAERIEIYGGTEYLQVGSSRQINYAVYPDEVDSSNLAWITSDESVATVDQNGVVTGHKAGHVKITLMAPNGLSESVEFDVVERQEYNMTVQCNYYTMLWDPDLSDWECGYLVNGERLDGDSCTVKLDDELIFTIVIKPAGDDSVPYEKSAFLRTVTPETVSSGMRISLDVDVMEDNGNGELMPRVFRCWIDAKFE